MSRRYRVTRFLVRRGFDLALAAGIVAALHYAAPGYYR